jgi:threonine 3-dehydrogenase
LNKIPENIMTVPKFVGQGIIEFVEKSIPNPGDGQLLIEVKANALCGSERGQFYHGSAVTPGHEAAGVVAAAGRNTKCQAGTHGVVFLMDFCGECRNCVQGASNQCLQKRGDMGFNKDGGYGKFMLVNENIFFPIDSDISFTEATMLLDIMGTGGHAIKRSQLVHQDIRSILITGAGPIGLGVLAMARILLGQQIPIIIADTIPYRLALAERLGGIPVNLKEITLQQSFDKQGFGKVDLAVDTSGKTAARESCIQTLDQRGVLICVGHGEGLNLDVSRDLIATERSVLGSEYFCFHELRDNLELLHTHRSYLGQIITHRYPVTKIQEAFELFFQGDAGKVVIEHE